MNPTNPIRIRRAFDGDTAARRSFYTSLGESDLWYRFFVSSVDAASERIDRLVDGAGVVAMIAESIAPSSVEIVGEAVAIPIGGSSVEFAIAVHPDFQRQGIGRRLTERIAAESMALGFDIWEAIHLPDNRAIEQLLAEIADPVERRVEAGVIRGWYRLRTDSIRVASG